MLRTCDKSQATSKEFEVPENVLSQEFCTLLAMEDKSFDISFYRQNLFEYEQGLAVPVVKGRLKAHFQFWVDIGAPPWVLETISSGYFIPFDSTPPSVCLPNNRSALDHHDFVSSAVSDLLKLGLVSEVSALPTVINPLSVSVNSEGKPRLILDLRHVNKHIPKAKFKMEDWRVFLQYVVRGGFMYKFDLKSGYHHIDICQSHQQFLGFKWHLDGCVDRYFCFTVLPFGLSSAPYLFTKFFRPLVRHWRSLGIHLVLYLDDGAGCEKDFASTQSCSDTVRSDLVKAGLVANCDKSIWIPTQCLDWLGISWDLLNATLTIPQPRDDRLLSALGVFKDKLPFVTPRFIASIVGKIISLSPCVGNVSLIMSRFLQSAVFFRHDWDTPLDLSRFQFFPQCLDEVNFWLDNCVKLNCKKLFEYSQPVVIVCTDASNFACGGYAHFVDKEEFDLFYQAFSSMESTLDSNGREMLAILYALRSFKALVRGKVVKLYTDNKNASIISMKGSMSLRLQRQALEIFQFCAMNNVTVEIEWIPRSLNEYADSLSRVADFDDWSVSTAFFDYIASLFGSFTVDRFASQAFSSMESTLDSNGREMLAILYALRSFKALVRGKVVKLYTDNKNTSIISMKGSMSLRLQRQALEIFQFCAMNNVTVEIEWIPRSLNEYADSLSRVADFDDWSVSTAFFDYIASLFGSFTVDRFASHYSAKCARFYSKFWCPSSEGVDAFSVDWAGENNWLVPPVYLIGRTIFHLEACGARGVLVVPYWPSAVFWPIVFFR